MSRVERRARTEPRERAGGGGIVAGGLEGGWEKTGVGTLTGVGAGVYERGRGSVTCFDVSGFAWNCGKWKVELCVKRARGDMMSLCRGDKTWVLGEDENWYQIHTSESDGMAWPFWEGNSGWGNLRAPSTAREEKRPPNRHHEIWAVIISWRDLRAEKEIKKEGDELLHAKMPEKASKIISNVSRKLQKRF